jgi:hypothetical protein
MLLAAGFASVNVALKEQSKEFIKDWMPGSGAEDFILSADITAWKGGEPIADNKAACPPAVASSVSSSCCSPSVAATPPVSKAAGC